MRNLLTVMLIFLERRRDTHDGIDYLLSLMGWVEWRPESSAEFLKAGVQCTRQNCLMLL